MYDAHELLELLNTQDIINVLHKLGIEELIEELDKGQLITNTICHNETGGSHKLYYLEDRKRFHCFTGCGSLSVYDLIIQRFSLKGIALSFPEAIQWLAENTGKSFSTGENTTFSNSVNKELQWMNRFKPKKTEIIEPEYISDYVLELFSYHNEHKAFTEDNISGEAMDRFSIRYDWDNNALIIPHRYYKNGKIIGLTSRNFNPEAIEKGFKYVPTRIQGKHYSHLKHLNLYGLYENKETIQYLKKVAIFEAEKSVMQCETYFGAENNFAVALGGQFISNEQIKMLIELGVEEVVLNFDKDFHNHHDDEAQKVKEHILATGRKLSPYMRVFTTFDTEGLLGYKDSPSDKGRDVLIQLFDRKEEILNER